ncbi:hypothetical protein Dsin_027489 [Dipteronia sinensis]|uniref:Uncharacterized protein n=1 Tax=Dipteronia sinensis TaxID=43782 RepID=A0AAE0DTC6_9ROSI|nr:hypothetical protein Dsin_027489 [Dipteronia sinensis]
MNLNWATSSIGHLGVLANLQGNTRPCDLGDLKRDEMGYGLVISNGSGEEEFSRDLVGRKVGSAIGGGRWKRRASFSKGGS